jgi:hypothetical protein
VAVCVLDGLLVISFVGDADTVRGVGDRECVVDIVGESREAEYDGVDERDCDRSSVSDDVRVAVCVAVR